MVGKKRAGKNIFKRYGGVSFWSVAFLVLIVFGAGFYVGNSLLSGRVVLGFEDIFGGDEDLVISLRQGELLPGDSSIIVRGKMENYTFLLSDLIEVNSEGNFYADGFSFSENGSGFGTKGTIISYPEIYFTLLVDSEEFSSDGGVEESDGEVDNDTVETGSEDEIAEENMTDGDIVEEPEEQIEGEEDAEITGEAISEDPEEAAESEAIEPETMEPEVVLAGEVISNVDEEIEGSVNYNEDFTYFVGGQSVAFRPGSIYVEEDDEVDYLFLDLEIVDGEIIVSTDYMLEEEGFGEEFLGEEYELRIDLEELGVNLSDIISVSLAYDNESLADIQYSDEVVVEKTLDESLLSDDLDLKQYGAVVGQPVKWVKVVNVSKDNAVVEVPKSAENLSVIKGIEEIEKEVEEAESSEVVVELEDKDGGEQQVLFTGQVSLEIDENEGILSKLFSSFWKSMGFTGNVALENGQEETILVDISDEVTTDNETVAVTYYTPAPISNETVVNGIKRVVVSAPDEYNYSDILVYTSVWDVAGVDEVPMDATGLQVKWYPNENVSLDEQNTLEENVEELLAVESVEEISESSVILSGEDLILYDVDSDGLVDFVGWVVPHLSEQTYEIIYITKAYELNSNRELVRDVYDYVSVLDGNYTSINPGNYIRVTFEQELDSTKDITLYANSSNGSVEVYEKDLDVLIMTFDDLSNFEESKLYLTNLVGVQDTFDLKIIDAAVEFDYIVDPYNSSNTSITGCGEIVEAGTYTLQNDMQIDGATCLTITADNVTLDLNGYNITGGNDYGYYGIYVDSYNHTTIKNGEIYDFSAGIYLVNSSNSTITNITSNSNTGGALAGIFFLTGSNNIVENSTLNNNSGWGIYISNSNNNQLINNTVESNSYGGIGFTGSHNNTVQDNTVKYNDGYFAGIELWSTCNDNIIIGNTLHLNDRGIYLEDSSRNSITDNDIWNCSTGFTSVCIELDDDSDNNTISGGVINISTDYGIIIDFDSDGNNISVESYNAVKAHIYIQGDNNRVNGTFDNSAVGIEMNGGSKTLYLLGDSSFNGTGINITANNVTLDMNGFNITGDDSGSSSGVLVDGYNYTTIKNGEIYNFDFYGIYLSNNQNNNITNITSSTGSTTGIYLETSSNNIISDVTVKNHSYGAIGLLTNSNNNTINTATLIDCTQYGVHIESSSSNNTFINVNISGSSQEINAEASTADNNLIYNNSFGEIKWIDETFRDDMDVTGDLTFPGTIVILNNSAYIDSDNVTALNSSANITLELAGWSFINPEIKKDGVACSDCYNFTPLDLSTVIFNVSSFSNYTIGEGVSVNLTGCANLTTADAVYTLRSDISTTGDCFNITANNITLDFNGFNITGDDGLSDVGIFIGGSADSKIYGGIVSDFGYGLQVVTSVRSNITNMTFNSNSFAGIKLFAGSNNTNIDNVTSLSDKTGIEISSSNNNISNTNVNASSIGVNVMDSAAGNELKNLDITSSVRGIRIANDASGNSFTNVDLVNNIIYQLSDTSSGLNSISYNNTFGRVLWSKTSIEIGDNLVFGDGVVITEAYTYLNDSSLDTVLNSTMNITFYDTNKTGYPQAKRSGLVCSPCSRLGTVGDDHTYNISSFGNYTVDYQNRIALGSGWNMISLGVSEDAGATEDVNVSLSAGWNLLGYSGVDNVTYTDLTVNGSAIALSVADGKIQKQFTRIDASAGKFKMAPYHETELVRDRAYWVYANESAVLTMPGARAAGVADENVSLSDIRFTNGSVEKNITQARAAGWVSGTNDSNVFYYGESQAGDWGWKNIHLEDDPFDDYDITTINSWSGIYVKTNIAEIELIS